MEDEISAVSKSHCSLLPELLNQSLSLLLASVKETYIGLAYLMVLIYVW